MLKKLIYFFKHGIWQKDEAETLKERHLLRVSKISVYTVRGLMQHDVNVRAASLTYFTLMAIVPVAALIFGIIKGFGLEENLTEYLYQQFGHSTEIVDYTLQFAENMLARTKGGIVAAFGFVLLFWAVVRVFGNIEEAINNIWEVKKKRSLARKFSDYIAVVVVAPVLWVLSNGLMRSLRESIESFSGGGFLVDILFGAISVIAIWLMFAFVYYIMPNTKVKIKGALIAGVIAGTIFQIFQIGYFATQGSLNSYNVVYGSFAALPLLLIWLKWSWMIFLVGAELSFAYQNIGTYEQERESMHMCYDRRRKVMLATMLVVAEHFLHNKEPLQSTQIAEEISMPVRIVRDVLYDLERAGLVAPVRSEKDEMVSYYLPARDIHELKVADVLDDVDCYSDIPGDVIFAKNPKMEEAGSVIDRMKTEMKESTGNIRIMDMIV